MALLLPTKAKSKKRRTNTRVWFWVDECKYSVVVDNVKGLGWKIVDEERHEAKSNMYWVDVAAIHERFRSIQAWQTINHFPGMPNIARKNRMGQNLNRMLKMFPREYDFYPRTWVLPGELADFRAQFDNLGNSLGNKIYIIKPDTGCQGRGIFLTRTFDLVPQQENVVAQLYIKKPLLLDGYKFDLRIYCLVSSVKPLRMYLFHDGLVRMCTEEYVAPTRQNITNTCMHLTNYAVNKHNSNFQQPSAKSISGNQDEGSKRSVSWFMNYIRALKGDSKADWLWNRIGTLCVRTVLSIIPTLSREYDQHFRSFGGVPYVLPTAVHERALYGGLQGSSSTSHHDKVFKTVVLRTKEQSSKGAGKNDDAEDSDDEDHSFQRVLSRVASSRSNGGEEAESRETLDPDSTGGGAVRVGVGGRHLEEQGEGEESGGTEEDGDVASEGKGADESNPNNNSSDGSGSGSGESEVKMPSYRGSRCFEILGFDVMLDSKLSPWLIEVNHLPSFGTDSPLDLDIKERLMHQALRSLAVLPDDEQAYLHYHKVEAEKRLMSMSRREKDKEDVPVEMTKMRPVPFSTNRSMGAKNVAPAPAPSRALGFHGLSHCALTPASASISSGEHIRESSGDVDAGVDVDIGMEKSRGTLLRAADVPEYVNIDGLAAASHSSNISTEQSSPQRVAEIRRTLLAIYAEFSPEKVPKIDRLLGKYAGREEEFLRFVREKYSIDVPAPALGVHAAAIIRALPSALSETRTVTADSSYFRNSDIGNRGDREIVRREQSITSTDVSTCSSAHSKSRSSSRSSSSSPSHSPRVGHESYHHHEADEGGSSSSNGKEIKSSLNYDAEADPGSAFDRLGDAERSPRNMTRSARRCAEPLPSSTSTSTSTGLLLSLDNPLLPNAQSQRTVGHRESRTAGGQYKGSGSQRGISPWYLHPDITFGGRSVSPPPSRRAIWKSTADEDTAYRAEVLQCHVPTEQDEWMQFETRALKEFTRIFPPEKKAVDKAFTEECEVEEEEGDDEDDASALPHPRPHPLAVEKSDALLPSKHLTVASTSSAPSSSSSSSSSAADVREPSASYEEIMYQVFLQDKRSTMRLHIPLPNRAIVKSDSSAETSTLPPLDHPNRPQIGTMAAQASKGLGWRAPAAKLPDTRDSLRNPTQTQLESANRLSQGLSVSMSYNMTKEAVSSGAGGSGAGGGLAPWMAGYGPHGTVYRQPISGAPASAIFDYEPPHDPEVHFGPQSYYQSQNQNYFQHQHMQHMQAGAGPGGIDGEAVWFKRSMKSSEEHRGRGGPVIGEGAGTGLGRLRSDIAKHGGMSQPYTPAAVLRQQVFSFDGRGAEGGSSFSASLSASASPPLSADHQGAHHTVTRGLTVGGNTQKYPALVRNRGAPSYDYTNSYSNTTANQSSSNSNIYNRR